MLKSSFLLQLKLLPFFALVACQPPTQHVGFASYDDAKQAGAIGPGGVPEYLPKEAVNIFLWADSRTKSKMWVAQAPAGTGVHMPWGCNHKDVVELPDVPNQPIWWPDGVPRQIPKGMEIQFWACDKDVLGIFQSEGKIIGWTAKVSSGK